MFVMFQIVALCLAADAAPSYTVHIRERATAEKTVRVPLSGSVCIRDAVEALKRPPRDLVRMDMWIARRAGGGEVKLLRVDWAALAEGGTPATNYILLAGDRLFIQARPPK